MIGHERAAQVRVPQLLAERQRDHAHARGYSQTGHGAVHIRRIASPEPWARALAGARAAADHQYRHGDADPEELLERVERGARDHGHRHQADQHQCADPVSDAGDEGEGHGHFEAGEGESARALG